MSVCKAINLSKDAMRFNYEINFKLLIFMYTSSVVRTKHCFIPVLRKAIAYLYLKKKN